MTQHVHERLHQLTTAYERDDVTRAAVSTFMSLTTTHERALHDHHGGFGRPCVAGPDDPLTAG